MEICLVPGMSLFELREPDPPGRKTWPGRGRCRRLVWPGAGMRRVFRMPAFILLLCMPVRGAGQALPALIPYTDGRKWGYSDTAGKLVIAPRWAEAAFFSGDKAKVRIPDADGRPGSGYALIDERGNYIIPPAAGWNGCWGGSWGASDLNAVDSTGKAGLIDPEGRLLLPYRWESGTKMEPPLQDSFKIVGDDGYFGIVNTKGELVVPCKWGAIGSSRPLSRLRAFVVSDPDNMTGNNRNGVADLGGRLLVPPRYSSVGILPQPDGTTVFAAQVSANNERDNRFYSGSRSGRIKYLKYPEGSILDAAAIVQPYEYELPGGYIVSGNRQALLDKDRDTIAACCFFKLSGDTLILRNSKRVGADSVAVTLSSLDLHSRRRAPLTRELMIYSVEPPKHYSRPFEGSNYDYERREPARIPIPDYGEVTQFYKDSMLYSVKAGDAEGRGYYIVSGQSRGIAGGGSYTAVVDSNLAYVVPPQSRYSIETFDPSERQATAGAYGYGTQGSYLLGAGGQVLMRLDRGKILSGFSWKGQVYAFIQVQDECNPEASGAQVFLTDRYGQALPAFGLLDIRLSGYLMRRWRPFVPQGSVCALDSAKRIGILLPDGSPVFPRLNFRYRQLDPVGNGWFLAGSGAQAARRLVDSANRPVLGDRRISSFEPVRIPADPYQMYAPATVPVPRLFRVSEQLPDQSILTYYIDDTGRSYRSGK